MQAIISALTAAEGGISATTIFAVVADLVPLILVLVPIALGLYFLRKLVKGAAKGKVRF